LKAEGTLPDPAQQSQFAEGSALTLTCEPSTNTEIRWERRGDSLPAHAYQTGSSLVFRRLEEIDRGTYRCEASVSGQTAYGDYSFDVINTAAGPSGGQAISSAQILSSVRGDSLRQDDRVTLQCNADGDGVFYEWTRYNNELLPANADVRDNILVIPSFKFEDEGRYICTASNIYGPSQTANTMLQLG